MNHYLVTRNGIKPWTTSRPLTWDSFYARQVLTTYRGMAFYLGRSQPAHVGYGPLRTISVFGNVPSAFGTPPGRIKGDFSKKAWSDFVESSARYILTGNSGYSEYYAIDRVPWEIHAIDDRFARESAMKAYFKAVEEPPTAIDLAYWVRFLSQRR